MDVYEVLVQAPHSFWETNHMSNNTKVYACIYIYKFSIQKSPQEQCSRIVLINL